MNNQKKWNQRYSQSKHLFGTEPNLFLQSQRSRFKPDMKALSIADGEAFNSLYLAELGLDVLSLDISRAAHEKARQNVKNRGINLQLICADILQFPLKPASFDLITVFFLHIPDQQRQQLHEKILWWLKPGGLILYECFYKNQDLQDGMPKNKNLLINEQQINRDFSELLTIHLDKKTSISYEETRGEVSVVTLQYAGLKKI